mmetsp:Transcript_44573/g.82674  ORF Transcript_44573/g.82674 Transcript_44573/m.82674 type:complete len:243 (-) Transcript_44573:281-1009(-)|eukprot:CAMPEP_0197442750 /NCGR_PEP_ID=MMETSP1175-20131217/8699_1 /TAXON_ID=1003142 /ORGANISM="Triceratium dubium, Strain CCMP147" /LENGTH=242 /DNA_ID=CAMNT_0042973281 /DNA_START=35 /DNA_END=763 /DNA_ORIENTATION=+
MAFTLSFDTSNDAGLAALNTFLESRSYVVGFAPTKTDVELYNTLGKAPNATSFPNVHRFYTHIGSFTDAQRSGFPAGVASSSAAVAAGAGGPAKGKGKGKKDDSDSDSDDMFADSDDDSKGKAKAKAAAAKAKAKAKAAAAAKSAKPKKAAPIAKTQVVYEVKTLEAGQDMAALEAAIRSITIDGLTWGEQFGVVDVAFGIQKLIVQCVIEDDKVELVDIEEKIEAFEDQVQSLDLATMNRL